VALSGTVAVTGAVLLNDVDRSPNRRFEDCAYPAAQFSRRRYNTTSRSTAYRRHENCAKRGMHNPQSSTILEHALGVVELARPLVDAVQRRDRDLASQLRRAISSIALNLAEGFGCTGGSARARFETARGSLNEAKTGIQVAVAWGYVSRADAAPVVEALHALGGRVYGLVRR